MFLDEKDLDAVEPLIGAMIEEGDNVESLKLRACYAFVRGDIGQAIKLQESARDAAADEWSEGDEAALVEYRAAVR